MDYNKLMKIIEKSTKPSSIFAKSILRENISSQVLHLFTSISFLLLCTIKLYKIHESSKNTPLGINIGALTYSRCERIVNFFVILSFGVTSLLYKYNSPTYARFINDFQSSINKNCFGLTQITYIKKWIKFNRFILTLQSITRILILTLHFSYNPFSWTFINSLNFVLPFMCESGMILEQQFILETCIYLQSNFVFFHLFFDSLTKKVNESPGVDVYHVIKSVRRMHSRTIEFTRHIDSFFRFTVFNTFLFLTIYFICIIGMLLAPDQTLIRILNLISRAIFISITLCVSSYHFARVNYLSLQVFNKVHDLSLSPNLVRSIETMNEINLFLLRISRDDVGLTFGGLCLVSVNFISSAAIIALTIGLALPSFFNSNST
uniref:Gustatory receptor n=1 Tax=Tetranychus urticae TaxID=32264 RepID=T1KRJ7_TETUR